jgi:hypothetical protein
MILAVGNRIARRKACPIATLSSISLTWPGLGWKSGLRAEGSYEICGGQSSTGAGFFSEHFGFPLSVSFH